MTLDIGTHVRSLVDLVGDDGSIVEIGSRGMVIGSKGDQLLVAFDEDGLTALASPWELLRQKPVRTP